MVYNKGARGVPATVTSQNPKATAYFFAEGRLLLLMELMVLMSFAMAVMTVAIIIPRATTSSIIIHALLSQIDLWPEENKRALLWPTDLVGMLGKRSNRRRIGTPNILYHNFTNFAREKANIYQIIFCFTTN